MKTQDTKQLPAVSEKTVEKLQNIETAIQELGLSEVASGFQKAFAISSATQELKAALTPEVMAPIMTMQGSSLGYRTDYDSKGGYPEETVKEALIEAVLRGVQPAGNQFNIIAGRCYVTREGFSYLLKNLKGFTDFKPIYNLPDMKPGRASVKCGASWKMNGKSDSVECEIPVRVNNNMGADAVLGKAARKLMARVYAQATGSDITDGEAETFTIEAETAEVPKPPTGEEIYGEDDLPMEGQK